MDTGRHAPAQSTHSIVHNTHVYLDMNKLTRILAIAAVTAMAVPAGFAADRLVILHTNDTHSQIDPDDNTDLGGVLRRKVLIDSVRAVEPNVMVIDAGDVVQGSLFFNLYGGDVENKLMDAMGYDIRILGNHEFDNGSEELAKKIKDTKSQWLSTNYKITLPGLKEKFAPYTTRTFDGKKIGFIALNLDPKGIVSEGNYDGIEYMDLYDAANATAWYLKNLDGCDMVVAITHIGYEPTATGTSDLQLAPRSRDIDIIIGGHSHTVIDPAAKDAHKPYLVPNANGDFVLVTQTGKSGRNLGEITIDLDKLTSDYRLIPVNKRLDNRLDPKTAAIIAPYRRGVDSLMNVKVARSAIELRNDQPAMLNFVADFIKVRGDELAPNVDFAMTNKGGLRRSLPKGDITEGQVMMALPFNNKVEVIDITGKDLLENFDVMALYGGNGVSKEVDITYDPKTHKCVKALINGKPVDPKKTYRLATIDYLANGGDYMTPLTRGVKVAASKNILSTDILHWMRTALKGKTINPSTAERMRPL